MSEALTGHITLEVFGSWVKRMLQENDRAWRRAGYNVPHTRDPPFVAKVTADGLEYLDHMRSYRHANSKGTRGVYDTFILERNTLYYVAEQVSWSRVIRYHAALRVDGSVYKLSDEEAQEWIENGL